MDARVVGLLLLGLATVSGVVLFTMFALASRRRERAIDAGVITMHGGVGLVAVATWFVFTNGSAEFGAARGFVMLLLAVVLATGLLMLGAVQRARRDDPDGEVIPEASVSPLHITGHLLVGAAAIVAVVIAAYQG